jgi:hypothetical protein
MGHAMTRKSKGDALEVEWRLLADVKPYEGNPRIIPQSAVAKVSASIRQFGWRQPIVVDRSGVIIAGHTRRLAALALGLDKVPVHVAIDMTAAQVRAYRLADNRVSEESRWDIDALTVELREIAAIDGLTFDLSEIGFDPIELPDIAPAFSELPQEAVQPLDEVAARTCPHCGKAIAP